MRILAGWQPRVGGRSTRAILVALVLVTAAPLFAAIVVSINAAQRQGEARVVEERVALARVVAQRFDAVVGDSIAALRSLAQTEDVVNPASRADLGLIFARVAETSHSLESISLVGADGRLAVGAPGVEAAPIADRPHFQRAMSSGQPVVSGAPDPATGRPTATVLVPFLRGNGERAVLTTPLPIDTLLGTFLGGRLGAGISLTVVDSDGAHVVRFADRPRILAASPDRPDVRAALRGEVGALRLTAPDGAEALAAYAPVPVAGWGVVLVEPADAAFGDARGRGQLVLAALAAVLAAALAAAWWLGGQLDAAQRSERVARASAESAVDRTARLQAVTAALSATLTHQAVAEVALAHGAAAVGARAGWVLLCTPDGAHLELLHAVGLPDELLAGWRRFPLDRPSAIAEAARVGEPVYLGSPEEALARYPGTVEAVRLTANAAWAAVPLLVGERSIGAIGFSFAERRRFDRRERELIETIARLCAQALERARLYEAEHAARLGAEAASRRVGFLASASRILASSLDHERTLQQVARLAVPDLADWCVVDLQQPDGTVRRIAVVHADPARAPLALELQRDYAQLAPDAAHTASRVIGSGRSWLDPAVSPERLAAQARDARHLALLEGLGFAAEMVVPLIGREGVLGAITLVASTPERRYGPDELALAEELAQRCAIAIENARLYAETRAAVATRDEFLAIASHELLTPVTSLRGQAQLLRRSVLGGLAAPEQLARRADAVLEGADRLTALVRDLLDVARIRTERLQLHSADGDVAAFLRGLAERERERLGPAHPLRLDLPDHPCPAEFDPQRLDQVLLNLLDNAVKYSPDGGEILVRLDRAGDAYCLAVVDRGIGIPAAALEKIFEPFGRAPNAERSSIPGMGLGLHICRNIVERHGGRLWAESPGEGQGTTFFVELPRSRRLEASLSPDRATV